MPSNSKPGGKHKATQNRPNKSSKERDAADPKLPITSNPIRADGQRSPYHCQITCKEEKTRWDRIKPFVEVAGVILLAVYTGYTIKMYGANKKSADAAKEAADTAAHQLEVDERPWILFRGSKKYGTPIQISAGKRLSIPGQFMNTGKTPALHVRATVFVQIVGPGNDADLPGKNQPIPEPGKPFPKGGYHVQSIPPQFDTSPVLYPSQYTKFTVFQVMGPYNGRDIPLAISSSEYQNLRQGKSYIAVWGEIWYQDIFGVNHWSKFCKEGDPAGRVPDAQDKKCVEYSDVDNNE